MENLVLDGKGPTTIILGEGEPHRVKGSEEDEEFEVIMENGVLTVRAPSTAIVVKPISGNVIKIIGKRW